MKTGIIDMEIIPVKYKIKQDINEHVYYIELMGTAKEPGWFVTIRSGSDWAVLCKDGGWSAWSDYKQSYATPEEALEFWKSIYVKK